MVMVLKNYSPVAKTTSMDRDEIEKQLQQLVLEIKQYPATNARNRLQRRKIITHLLNKFRNLVVRSEILVTYEKRLRSKYRDKLASNNIFEDCYQDALQQTWLYISLKIAEYDPQKASILDWFYIILNYRFLDAKNKYLKIRKVQRDGERGIVIDESLNKPIDVKQNITSKNLNTYQDIIKSPYIEDNLLNPVQEFKQMLIDDPWSVFSGKHIKNKPTVNYQTIAIQKLKESSWDEIGTMFNLSVGTITPFFSRSHAFFKPFIYEYLQGEFKLLESTRELIIEDRQDKLKRIQMKDYLEINFQTIMIEKINGKSWIAMEKHWNSNTEMRSLIYFYLKTIKRLDKVFENEFNLYNFN